MDTPWDARTYDETSPPQRNGGRRSSRARGDPPDATVMDVGCGTGRVTEPLLALVPRGRVLAIDASEEMVALARRRLGDRARGVVPGRARPRPRRARRRDRLDGDLHWVTDHDRLWARLARALRPAAGSRSSAAARATSMRVREVIEAVARDGAPELVGWSPGSSRGRRRPSGACGRRASPRSGAGWRTPDASTGRRRVRAHVDPPRALARSPGAARVVRRRRRGWACVTAGLRLPQRLRHNAAPIPTFAPEHAEYSTLSAATAANVLRDVAIPGRWTAVVVTLGIWLACVAAASVLVVVFNACTAADRSEPDDMVGPVRFGRAVDAVNAGAGTGDTINLPAGHYRLTLGDVRADLPVSVSVGGGARSTILDALSADGLLYFQGRARHPSGAFRRHPHWRGRTWRRRPRQRGSPDRQ